MYTLLVVMIYSLYRYRAVTQHCDIECCCMWPADITVGYCTWSDMWYSFRTSVYLICILKQNIVHGVTYYTVSEHQYISHIHLNNTFKGSVFSFRRQLLQWMVLSVVVTVQYHQYQLIILKLNVNTRMGQDVSVRQRQDFVYRVVGEEK